MNIDHIEIGAQTFNEVCAAAEREALAVICNRFVNWIATSEPPMTAGEMRRRADQFAVGIAARAQELRAEAKAMTTRGNA